MRRAIRFGLTFCAFAAALAPATAADYSSYERRSRTEVRVVRAPVAPPLMRGYTGALPACSDERVLGRIAGLFATRERGYWSSDLTLDGFAHPREIGYRTWGAEFIPRRFCRAKTLTTDGRKRHVFYEIGEGFGFAGLGWDVNWCVTGLDRNMTYAPGCKMAQP